MKGHVVLIHGIWSSPIDMMGLARHLRRDGYRVHNYGYLSMLAPIERHAAKFHAYLVRHKLNDVPDLHLVGHSMGGLVIRAMMRQHPELNVQSVIMLGTPNHGSAWPDLWRARPVTRAIFDFIYGPAFQQLSTQQEQYRHLYPDHLPCPVGIIAATYPVMPMASKVLDGPHDGMVTVESTKLPGMADFVIVPASHPYMMDHVDTKRHVRHFLAHRRFASDVN